MLLYFFIYAEVRKRRWSSDSRARKLRARNRSANQLSGYRSHFPKQWNIANMLITRKLYYFLKKWELQEHLSVIYPALAKSRLFSITNIFVFDNKLKTEIRRLPVTSASKFVKKLVKIFLKWPNKRIYAKNRAP